MKIVDQSYEILEQEIPVHKLDDYSGYHFREQYLENMYRHIERCGRTCYKSEDRITPDSSKKFVNGLIKSKHCYTGDSEVLTDQGWIKWKDYNGEKIATVNSNLDFIGYEIPERIIKHTYSGNFYEYPELGLKVTDGHTMFGMFRDSKHNFYKEYNYEKFTCNTPYNDNNGRSKTLGERTFKVPVACNKPLITDPYYELIGFWLGDGCHTEDITNKLKFHLKKERKIKYLESLCNKLGYKFEVCKSNQYSVNCPNIGRLFNSLYYENGNKKIEEYNLTPIQIHSIIQGLIKSDGNETTTKSKTIHLNTTSESIKNWLLRFAPLGGYNITYSGVKIFNNPKWKPSYKLYFISSKYIINNNSRKKDKKVIITNESNEVFCVTVSTGLLLVRGTNGQVSICGNCSVLEHGAIYLKCIFNPSKGEGKEFLKRYTFNQYSKMKSKVLEVEDFDKPIEEQVIGEKLKVTKVVAYVTTNFRVLVENNWLDDLKYLCEPTKYHELRHTALLHSCIHVYKDLTRHRKMSFSIESTRYCNYFKGKFGSELKFVRLPWTKIIPDDYDSSMLQKLYDDDVMPIEDINFIASLCSIEETYMYLIKGKWEPQQAAEILPQCLAADVIMSGFESDWKHVFNLRSDIAATGKPHPLVEELMTPLRKEMLHE